MEKVKPRVFTSTQLKRHNVRLYIPGPFLIRYEDLDLYMGNREKWWAKVLRYKYQGKEKGEEWLTPKE